MAAETNGELISEGSQKVTVELSEILAIFEQIKIRIHQSQPREPMSHYQFTVVIESDEDGFHAYVPSLRGCHTFGATIDEARANILEAMGLHVESMLEDGNPIPAEREPIFITRLTVPVAA